MTDISKTSKKLLQVHKRATRADKKSDMDRLRDHWLYDHKISFKLKEYNDKLIATEALLRQGYSVPQCVKFLREKYGVSQPTGNKYVRDAYELFGDVGKVNKDGLKYILTGTLQDVMNYAKQKMDLPTIVEAVKEIAKLNGLYFKEGELPDLSFLQLNFQLNFTSDVGTLKKEDATTVIPEYEVYD